jgi:hypothetical protein
LQYSPESCRWPFRKPTQRRKDFPSSGATRATWEKQKTCDGLSSLLTPWCTLPRQENQTTEEIIFNIYILFDSYLSSPTTTWLWLVFHFSNISNDSDEAMLALLCLDRATLCSRSTGSAKSKPSLPLQRLPAWAQLSKSFRIQVSFLRNSWTSLKFSQHLLNCQVTRMISPSEDGTTQKIRSDFEAYTALRAAKRATWENPPSSHSLQRRASFFAKRLTSH